MSIIPKDVIEEVLPDGRTLRYSQLAKTCECGKEKTEENTGYRKGSSQNVVYFKGKCIECSRTTVKDWQKLNKEKQYLETATKHLDKITLDMTPEELEYRKEKIKYWMKQVSYWKANAARLARKK